MGGNAAQLEDFGHVGKGAGTDSTEGRLYLPQQGFPAVSAMPPCPLPVRCRDA
jgi:hypothetical protein